MKTRWQPEFSLWRFNIVIFAMLLFILSLTARIIDLSVNQKKFLQRQSDLRTVRTVQKPKFRGVNFDRNNYPLAVSALLYKAWINSKEFVLDSQTNERLEKILNIKKEYINNYIALQNKKNHIYFPFLKNIQPQAANAIKQLHIPGLYLQSYNKRFYPEGESVSQLLGFTNDEDHGQEGLELAYDNWLSGTQGQELLIKDRIGRDIIDLTKKQNQVLGSNITLSIDKRLQYLAYKELMQGVQSSEAASGSAIILNARTGEILALANFPSFNPNSKYKNPKTIRNVAIADTFEPGSTLKAFSVASALMSGKFQPDTIIDTNPGWLKIGKNIVRDEHPKGVLNLAEVLDFSSNVGITKMILSIPQNNLWELLHQVGFGEMTGVGLPGDASGRIVSDNMLKPFALATLSWGYGISVSALQLAGAYSVFANEGIKLPLTLIKRETIPEGVQVMTPNVANKMLKMLETVIASNRATGKLARIPGYRVAGKTGTARIAGAHGYNKNNHISSFVGIAPVSKPLLVVAVVLYDPKGKKYYGGQISAPVFKGIMENSLRLLNTEPDGITT